MGELSIELQGVGMRFPRVDGAVQVTKEGHSEAKRLARQAIALHPDFPMPGMLPGWVLASGVRFDFIKGLNAAMDEAESLVRGLLAEDEQPADGHTLLGYPAV